MNLEEILQSETDSTQKDKCCGVCWHMPAVTATQGARGGLLMSGGDSHPGQGTLHLLKIVRGNKYRNVSNLWEMYLIYISTT